jgi:hypothetical protein
MIFIVCPLGAFGQEEDEAPAKTESGKPIAGARQPPGVKSGQKKRTDIDFEDELIEGEMKKPELFYLLQKKQFNFKRLIKLREDFLPEMRRDADEVRKTRSKN